MATNSTTASADRDELGDDATPEDPQAETAAGDDEQSPPKAGSFVRMRHWLRGTSALTCSMIAHLIGLLVLGMLFVEEQVREELHTIVAQVFEERPEDEPVEIKLEQDLEAAKELTQAVFSASPLAGLQGAVAGMTATQELERKVVDSFDAPTVSIESPLIDMPTPKRAIEALPEGQMGQERAIVADYQEALDRITQELMWMLEKSDVMVCWCFDQSESMKDDQKEIRNRIHKVYSQLGLSQSYGGDHLTTAVTSYGGTFMVHTKRPTSDRDTIRAAIDSVPVDPSGKEMMCEAVIRSIAGHREYSRGGRRQMAMVLVTDESGDRQSNQQLLERAIAEAKATKCRLYILGREAVFGYPYVYMRWRHPQTERVHWLPVDRGPETGFVEQLQTDGLRRRYDAFPSGFGPYEQARMAKETNGIFFMLPSLESALVRGEKRKYELEAMREYRPDLRARIEVFADRDKFPVRTLLWRVIQDLNPHNKTSAQVVEMRHHFSLEPNQFLQQVRREQQKATLFIRYLGEAQRLMEVGVEHRRQEANPRWQANYDLVYAQSIGYQARLYEYGAGIENFLQNFKARTDPAVVPRTKSPDLLLTNWAISTRRNVLTEESKPYIEKATELLKEVIKNHPGTPWAGRAEWELKRGFGIDLVPDYDRPYKKVSNPSPIPQL